VSELILKVEGMSCGHCVSAVEKAIEQIGGEAKVELASKRVTISFDEQVLSQKEIVQAIEEQGYDVV